MEFEFPDFGTIWGDIKTIGSDILDFKKLDVEFDIWKQKAQWEAANMAPTSMPIASSAPMQATGAATGGTGGFSQNMMLWIGLAGLAIALVAYVFPRR